jgi:type II secretory pathway pseudopilin PulG
MAALLVTLAVMAVLMAVALPPWRHMMQREREAELVFRGEQYARAIGLFQRKFAGAFPPSIDVLVQQKFLRKKYKDPMVPDGEFQVLYQTSTAVRPGQVPGVRPPDAPPDESAPSRVPGVTPGQGGAAGGLAFGTAGPRGGVTGVVSKSNKLSIRLYKGRNRYNEWQFVYIDVSQRIDQGGTSPTPGMPGGNRGRGPGPGSRPGGMGGPGPGPRPFGSPTGTMEPRRPGPGSPQP